MFLKKDQPARIGPQFWGRGEQWFRQSAKNIFLWMSTLSYVTYRAWLMDVASPSLIANHGLIDVLNEKWLFAINQHKYLCLYSQVLLKSVESAVHFVKTHWWGFRRRVKGSFWENWVRGSLLVTKSEQLKWGVFIDNLWIFLSIGTYNRLGWIEPYWFLNRAYCRVSR